MSTETLNKYFDKQDSNMSIEQKKELLQGFIGKNTNKLDLNEVRDEWKYGKDRL